ncbi:hypothetical protein CPB86DRAFT_738282 [Serendipita vermifera]|nr:hypothetical protein CPB86DRAFT_738282 [Serendipita vermifera]
MRDRFLALLSLALIAVAPGRASPSSSPLDTDESVWSKLAARSEGVSTISKRDITWNPPSELVLPLQQVWDHEMSTYSDPLGFKNYGFDQIMANKGYINYCVRWESTTTITQAQRTQVETKLQQEFQKWMQYLIGYDGFPYSSVPVKVVGWAVKSTSLLSGSTSGYDVYTTVDSGGIAECDPRCGRFFHQDANYGSCPGGADRHYDMSLWLTDGMSGGAGGDWGQRIGREYFMGLVSSTANAHILLHEMGHTFALDDFYDWTPTGVTNFIMLAGSSTEITPFDYWMFRDWWTHLKSRYNLSTTSTSTSRTSTTTTRTSTTTTRSSTTTTRTTTASTSSSTGVVAKWGQCGGLNYTGPTQCVAGTTCTYSNDWYSQCL